MAAETELKIQVDVDGTRKLDRLERKIRSLERTVDKLGMKSTRVFRDYGRTMENTIGKSSGKWKRHFDDLDGLIKKFGTATLGGLKLALKAAGAEMALMAISMVALHGLFKIGQGLVKTYQGLLNVLSGAAAGAAVSLAAVSAALREQNAAMFAFRGNTMKGYDGFVNGVNKVRVVMRGLHRDQSMAAAGAANLDAAFAAVSRKSTFTGGSQNMLRDLMDFAAAGGDIKKGMSTAGDLIGTLQTEKGTGWKGIAKSMGPQMEQAFRELGIKSREEFQEALSSGALAKAGGVTGQWGAVSGTLISEFKKATTIIRADFADLGQSLLKPLKETLDEMVATFRNGLNRVWLPLLEFAHGPFLDSLGGFTEKLSDMFVNLVRRGPEVEGMFERIGDRWRGFVDGWNDVIERLQPMIEGARVLEGMFGEMFGSIGDYIRESFGRFSELLQENEPEVRKFGARLGELFASFGRFQNELKELFFQALPFINKVLGGVRNIVDVLGSVIRGGRGIMGAVGDGAGAYGLMAGAMVILSKLRSWAGGFLFQKQTNTMNVTAGSVNVGGAPLGGATGVTGGGQMNAVKRAEMEKQGMRSMTYGQRVASDNRAMQHQAAMGGSQPTWVQRKIGSRWRAMRQPSEAMRGRISGSMGTRMGLGMGLGMLSSRVDEESQGVMGLGAAASFVNPMIGGAIAGLGVASTSTSTVQSTLGGIGGGAALGMQLGGPWGALGGAIIGGAYGALTAGARKAAKQKKAARAAGEAMSNALFESVTSHLEGQAKIVGGARAGTITNIKGALQSTGLRDLTQRLAVAQATGLGHGELLGELSKDSRFKDLIPEDLKEENWGDVIGAMATRATEDWVALSKTLNNTEKNINAVSKAFGVGNIAINEMAAVTETDLVSATAGFGWIAKSLAGALVNDIRELGYAQADRTAAIQSGLANYGKKLEAPKSFDEAAQNIRNIVQASDGNLSDTDKVGIADELSNMFRYSQELTGSATGGARAMNELFGPGGQIFGENQMLEGMEGTLMNIPGISAAIGANASSVRNQRFDASEVLISQLLSADMKGANGELINQSDILSQLSNSDMQMLENSGLLSANAFFDDQGNAMTASQIEQMLLEKGGIRLSLKQMSEEELRGPEDAFSAAVDNFVTAVNTMIKGDTSTPRRNMVKMSNMLGRSSSSDHASGDAFDLYGSGLGSEMTSIRNAGGYADMHGAGKTRHLHAVPGQGMGGGGTSNQYVINVTGGDNASPAQIADEVMDRIDRRSVDNYERA